MSEIYEPDHSAYEAEVQTLSSGAVSLSKKVIEITAGLSGRRCALPKECPVPSPASGVDCYQAVNYGSNMRCPLGSNRLLAAELSEMTTP